MDPPYQPSSQPNGLADLLSKHEIQDFPHQESDFPTSGYNQAKLLACIYHLSIQSSSVVEYFYFSFL